MNILATLKQVLGRLSSISSLYEYGAVLDGATDDLPALNKLLDYIGPNPSTLLVAGQCYVSANVAIPANIKVRFEAGGAFVGPGIVTFTRWESILAILVSQISGTAAASAYLTLALALPANTPTVINYDTVDYDTDAAVTTGAAWKFTCPAGKGGKYHVSAALDCGTVLSGGLLELLLYKNGALYRRIAYGVNTGAASNFVFVDGSIDLILAPGDTLDLRGRASPGALNVNVDVNNKQNYVSIHRVAGA